MRVVDLAQGLARFGVPDLNRAVGAGRQHELAVARITDRANLAVRVRAIDELGRSVVQLGPRPVQRQDLTIAGRALRGVNGAPVLARVLSGFDVRTLALAGHF